MRDATELLLLWHTGDEQARSDLMEQLHCELQEIATRQLANERFADLDPSALVNEAYLRLIDLNSISWQNRSHFLALSAKIMRDILVSEARKRNAAKRSGGLQITLIDQHMQDYSLRTDALLIHQLLDRLSKIDEARANLVELRFFGGLTLEETAEVLGISLSTAKRSWQVARGWLYKEINRAREESGPDSATRL